MDKRGLERLFMMQSLIGYIQSPPNAPIVNQVPAFITGTTTLQSIVDQITAISGSQSQSVAGGGTQKEFYRNQLNQMTFTIINVVKGYALSIQNFDLAKQLSFSLNAIVKISDKLIADTATNWMNIVEPLIPSLSPWGITQTSIDSWETTIANYQSVYQLPVTKKNTRKQLTSQIYTLVNQGVAVCKTTLDTSVNSFAELGFPAFVQEYHYYRKLQHTATVHTKLRAYVLNQLGRPVTEGEILIVGTPLSGLLDVNGFCMIDLIPFGNQQVALTTVYGTDNYTFEFKKGQSLTKHFQVGLPVEETSTTKETTTTTKTSVEK